MNGNSSDVATSRQASGQSRVESAETPTTDHSVKVRQEDDEEEEGMVKVEEEGQIEEDGPNTNQLYPPASSHGGNSPQPIDHDRERSRHHGASPDPSSSYAAARTQYGHTPEYGASTSYMHRDSARADAYPARPNVSGNPARMDNHRHSYGSASSSSSRGPDVYRPSARDREREWDIAREREIEWALERDRDPYRYREPESRRDWEHRERSMMSSHYEAADYPPSHPGQSPYGSSSGYGFDSRDYATRRPLSPAPSSRERGWERDRVTDHTDSRSRSQSSAWGMRSWGKPSDKPADAAWDSRQRRPTSVDIASQTSNRPFNTTYTPPPAARSMDARPSIASFMSDRGEPRSRESSPRSTRSAGQGPSPRHLGNNPGEASPRQSPRPVPTASAQANQASLSDTKPVSQLANTESFVQARDTEPKAEQLDSNTSAAQDKPLLERMNKVASPTHQAADSKQQIHDAEVTLNEVEADEPNPLKDDGTNSKVNDVVSAPASALPQEADLPKAASLELPESEAHPPKQEAQEPASVQSDEQLEVSPPDDAAPSHLAAASSQPAHDVVVSAEADGVLATKAGETPLPSTQSTAQDSAADMDVDNVQVSTVPAEPQAPVTESVNSADNYDKQSSPNGATKASNEQIDEATSVVAPNKPSEVQPVEPTQERLEATLQPIEETQHLSETPANTSAVVPVSSVSLPAVSSALEAADVSMIAQYARAEEEQREHLGSQQPVVHEPASVAQDSDVAATASIESVSGPPQGEAVTSAQSESKDGIGEKDMLLSNDEQVTRTAPPTESVDKAVEEGPVLPSIPTTHKEISAASIVVKQEPPSGDVSMGEVSAELVIDNADEMNDTPTAGPASQQPVLPSKVEANPRMRHEPSTVDPDSVNEPDMVTDLEQSADIDLPTQVKEAVAPPIRFGQDQEAAKEELVRMQELEVAPALATSLLDINGLSKDIEPPMMTPKTKEEIDMVTRAAIWRALSQHRISESECVNIPHENQKLSQSTTMNFLQARVHGIPQIVSDKKPLWIEDDDDDVTRSKAYIFNQMMDRQKRTNKKVEALKNQYRTINAEWKLHCARLDRIVERREQQQRRPAVATPSGTPAGSAMDESNNGGSGILSAALLTGRANRRNTQTGFAGFGDAVRSEAEFLEILASLENADMQDPSVRAARTTATAPDMQLDPYHNRPLEQTYDDVNGYVANPLAFYLDKFDPDVWTGEEKAIFARRYALWPKQFGKIAQALPHKTASQCVRYYYLNKKAPGNDFKALAAARNRERKRKARGKPKKAKGSALMADLKSAKGEELEEDDGGIGSPGEPADGIVSRGDASGAVTPRRGGAARSRMPTSQSESSMASAADELGKTPLGKKRSAGPDDPEATPAQSKTTDKRRPTPKTKRTKTSDSAKLGDKFKKARTAAKQEPMPDEPMRDVASPQQAEMAVADAAAIETKQSGVEESDLAAAEALGALANMFGTSTPSEPAADTSFERSDTPAIDGESQKPGKKRKSKHSLLGQEEAEPGSKGNRSKQPTSSYWSVAERSEFLRALALHGKQWEVVSSTLSQKSAAQARNYFARNCNEADFMDAAALAGKNHGLPLTEREAAATLFVRQRSAANAAQGNTTPSQTAMPTGGAVGGVEPMGAHDAPRTTYLPPPPALSSSVAAEPVEVSRREESLEPVTVRRGLQINSLLNSTDDTGEARALRRQSGPDWPSSHSETPRDTYEGGREGSLPASTFSRRTLAVEPETRPSTAGETEIKRPSSPESRLMSGSAGDGRSRMYEPFGVHRHAPGYATMAPPHYPAERYSTSQPSRYSLPPPSVPNASRSLTPHHLSGESETPVRPDYGRFSAAPPDYRSSSEHESKSLPPLHTSESRHGAGYEKTSPTNGSFSSSMNSSSYGRYSSPAGSVGALYSNSSRRSVGGPHAPIGPSERSTSEHRWQRPSASPGAQVSSGSASNSHGYGASSGGAYSTGNTYRSAGHAYSNYPSQNLPRPSLPSVSSSGRSLAPLLGTFPGAGPRPLATSRPRPSDDSQHKWPYAHPPHDNNE